MRIVRELAIAAVLFMGYANFSWADSPFSWEDSQMERMEDGASRNEKEALPSDYTLQESFRSGIGLFGSDDPVDPNNIGGNTVPSPLGDNPAPINGRVDALLLCAAGYLFIIFYRNVAKRRRC